MAGKREVIALLGALSPEDRAEVVKWCEALGIKDTGREGNPIAEFVYQELTRCLAKYYHTDYPPNLFAFARARPREHRKLLLASDVLKDRVEKWWPTTQRLVQLALVKYLVSLAFDATTRSTHYVTTGRIIDALFDIEATINDVFPGWLNSGMFTERVLARVTGGKTSVRHQPIAQAGAQRRLAAQH